MTSANANQRKYNEISEKYGMTPPKLYDIYVKMEMYRTTNIEKAEWILCDLVDLYATIESEAHRLEKLLKAYREVKLAKKKIQEKNKEIKEL